MTRRFQCFDFRAKIVVVGFEFLHRADQERHEFLVIDTVELAKFLVQAFLALLLRHHRRRVDLAHHFRNDLQRLLRDEADTCVPLDARKLITMSLVLPSGAVGPCRRPAKTCRQENP